MDPCRTCVCGRARRTAAAGSFKLCDNTFDQCMLIAPCKAYTPSLAAQSRAAAARSGPAERGRQKAKRQKFTAKPLLAAVLLVTAGSEVYHVACVANAASWRHAASDDDVILLVHAVYLPML
jgi:hypothetical protein